MAGKLRSFFIRDLLGETISAPKTNIGKFLFTILHVVLELS